jgi:hypothetical protein
MNFVLQSSKFRSFGIAAVLPIAFIQGCSSNAPFNSISNEDARSRQTTTTLSNKGIIDQEVLYKFDGHYSTAGYIAKLAGYSDEKIRKLSCYTQTPDQEELRYSAPYVAIWGITNPSYRHQIVNSLHSLHGGDHTSIKIRRERLKTLIIKSLNEDRPNWEAGFLIHALGDSYAHVHGTGDGEHAYGEGMGHAVANLPWGERPDSIFVGSHYLNYNLYANDLFSAFVAGNSSSKGDSAALKKFTDEVIAEAAKGEDSNKKVSFLFNEIPIYSDSEETAGKRCESLNQALDKNKVRGFLRELSIALDA